VLQLIRLTKPQKGSTKVDYFSEITGYMTEKRQLRPPCRKAKDRKPKIENTLNFSIMKTMQDFAAQQLSKKQMNQIAGGYGQEFFCTCDALGANQGETILWIEKVYDASHISAMIDQHCANGGSCRAMNV